MDSSEARSLRTALHALAGGRPHEALVSLRSLPPSAVTTSGTLVAEALLLEQQRRYAEAAERFEAALALGVPVAEVQHACGSWLVRAGDRPRARRCLSLIVPGALHQRLADVLEAPAAPDDPDGPEAMRQHAAGLPIGQQVPYATLVLGSQLRSPRPGLYGMQPLKAELVQQLGAAGAAVAYAPVVGAADGTIAARRVVGLHEHARAHGARFEELAPARRVLVPDTPCHRVERGPSVEAVTRAFFSCVLEDAVVSCKSSIVYVGTQALLDATPQERALYPVDLDVDPTVVGPVGDELLAVTGAGASGPAVATALSLCGVHSFNFGHWLLEFLPKVWAVAGRSDFRGVTVLVDEQMPPQLREALLLFLPAGNDVRSLRPGESVLVRRLWVVPMITYFPLGPRAGASDSDAVVPLDGELFVRLLASVAPVLEGLDDAGRSPSRQLFLTRKDSQHRRLVNRVEVEDALVQRGFEVVDLEELAFVEQLRLVRSARTIIGPDGSSLLLGLLARPGTRIGYLSNPYLEDMGSLASVHEALGHRLLVLLGSVVHANPAYRKFSDYAIDLGALPGFLEALEGGPRGLA